jgi:hypothetical protein
VASAEGRSSEHAADEYYRDIIEGLAIYTRSALHHDVLATITRHPAPDLGAAFNKNQIASKMWLAEALLGAVGPTLGEVTILGGWFGVLAAVLLHDPRFAIDRIVSIDIDPRCAAIAESGERDALCAPAASPRVPRICSRSTTKRTRRAERRWESGPPDQHELRAPRRLRPLVRPRPDGAAAGLQSNDYFACDQHVNCVADLPPFRSRRRCRR